MSGAIISRNVKVARKRRVNTKAINRENKVKDNWINKTQKKKNESGFTKNFDKAYLDHLTNMVLPTYRYYTDYTSVLYKARTK